MGDGALATLRVGEVVEADSTSFVAQCYQLYAAPSLGSFVRTSSPTIVGVVSRVSTEPLDSTRPVLARGEAESAEEDIYRNNPQLSRLFTTRFEVLIAGHWVDDTCRQYLPPLPPQVHSFVYSSSSDEIAQFTEQLDFLHLLLNSGLPIADDVVGACLRGAASAQPDDPGFFARASKSLAVQLAGDANRLMTILRRMSP